MCTIDQMVAHMGSRGFLRRFGHFRCLRIGGGGERDIRHAASDDPEAGSGGAGEIDATHAVRRLAIVHFHHDRAAGIGHRDAHKAAKRQGGVGRSKFVAVEHLAA